MKIENHCVFFCRYPQSRELPAFCFKSCQQYNPFIESLVSQADVVFCGRDMSRHYKKSGCKLFY